MQSAIVLLEQYSTSMCDIYLKEAIPALTGVGIQYDCLLTMWKLPVNEWSMAVLGIA